MTRPAFPSVINSSLLSDFRACPRMAFWKSIEHWKPIGESVHLHAGKSFAVGLEMARKAYFEQGMDARSAEAIGVRALIEAYGDFQCPADSAKSCERMVGALMYYFERYPLDTEYATPAVLGEGRLGIEFSFAEPLGLQHPETGDPLLFCGRFDQLVSFQGALFGEDDKTTSQLGASWPRKWDMRSQFTSYCWAAQQTPGLKLAGFLVRGVSILKTKYDTLEAITYRPQWMIDRWYEQTLRDVKRMIQMWESGYWDYNLDEACESYGGCSFKAVCLSGSNPEAYLAFNYERRVWNPLTRIETAL